MKKIEIINIEGQQVYTVTFASAVMLFLGFGIFSATTGVNNLSNVGIYGILVFVLTIFAHELLHGLGFIMSGVRPSYGVGLIGPIPIAYATTNKPLSVAKMLFVAYLPLVALSFFYILVTNLLPQFQSYALIGFIANIAGAAGDVSLSSKLLKYVGTPNVLVQDTKSGLVIFSDNPIAIQRAKKTNMRQKKTSSFMKVWAISSLGLLLLSILMPIILSLLGFNGRFIVGFENFNLFSTSINSSNEAISINFIPSLMIGLVISVISRIFSKWSSHF